MGAWKANRRMWVALLALLAVNVAALAAYQLIWAGRAQERVARFDRSSVTHRRLVERREKLEEYVERARTSETQVATFLQDRLGRQRERETQIIAEVKQLARTAGLEPAQITYRAEEIAEQGLVRRSLVFTVSGSYLDLRKLVNLLELSESFIVLEEVSLSEADPGQAAAGLRINLQLSALYSDPEAALAAGSRRRSG
ncbi:MAG: hypothetical protein R3325_01570 [Thermoanaerobaculia bacterium]|nr:hypothetical protein [Thermoanaerobaculia bacterium]